VIGGSRSPDLIPVLLGHRPWYSWPDQPSECHRDANESFYMSLKSMFC
jgi:hypothetical protein